MNANELLAYNQGYNAGLKAGIDLNTEPMLRQQQNEIEFLKKEILEKHEDWKHEGQQAANARAEIEALKAKLNADKFCDANCVWTDHHPDCQIGKAQE